LNNKSVTKIIDFRDLEVLETNTLLIDKLKSILLYYINSITPKGLVIICKKTPSNLHIVIWDVIFAPR